MKNVFSRGYTAVVMIFLYAPILVLIAYSFNANKSRGKWTGFTFDWYAKMFHDSAIIEALVTTLTVAVLSSILATLIGTAAAIGIQTFKKRTKGVIMNITYLPVLNPEIVMGVSLMLLFVMLKIQFGITTLVMSHVTFSLPYVILNVLPKLRQMDKFVYEAALDLGCNRMQAFHKVMLPEIMPGIVTGFLMAFTFSVDDFIISYFVGGNKAQTLPVLIYSMTRKKISPEINALSAIIFVVVLSVLLIMNIKDARAERIQKQKRKEASFL